MARLISYKVKKDESEGSIAERAESEEGAEGGSKERWRCPCSCCGCCESESDEEERDLEFFLVKHTKVEALVEVGWPSFFLMNV